MGARRPGGPAEKDQFDFATNGHWLTGSVVRS
jgi:hypothetical protein